MLGILYLLAFIVTVQTETDVLNEKLYNGWTPITRDKVFNILDKELINKEIVEDGNGFKQNSFEIEKSENNQGIIQEVIGPSYVNYNINRNERQSYFYRRKGTESNKENYGEDILSNEKYRQPKAISSNSIYAINNLATTNINELPDMFNILLKDKLIKDASVNQYEVTEKSDIGELGQPVIYNIEAKTQIDKFNETKTVKPESNEFTSKLLNILSNYNIRVNDVLPNYDISRNLKRNIPKQEYFLIPIPIRYSRNYNFDTDPMLVVLLSNGYLPSRYGRRYSNLYGNLASNINNKQLGSYQIYSDTDSSQ